MSAVPPAGKGTTSFKVRAGWARAGRPTADAAASARTERLESVECMGYVSCWGRVERMPEVSSWPPRKGSQNCAMRKKPGEPLTDRIDKDFVTSLQKGLDVLTSFSRQHSKLTLSEVARLTGSSPASARRSLHTLLALDYLESDGKRFWVAPRALLVAHAYIASRPTPQLAQPLLDALAERTRQSASMGKLLDEDVIIIARSTA